MAHRKLQLTAGSLSLALALVCGACSGGGGPTEEYAPVPNEKAPDHFKVRFDTTKGPVLIQIERDWGSEEHTSELQSLRHLVCRLLLEKTKKPAWQAHPGTSQRLHTPC